MLIGAKELDAMTAVQRQTYDAIAAGPRKDVPYPFLAMLDAPHLCDAIQAVGSAIRFSGDISDTLREVAILATAGAFGSGYEWDYHAAIARKLGMSEELIAATIDGDITSGIGVVDAATIGLCRAAVRERRVPQDLLEALVGKIGRSAASEIVAIAGYYPLLALFLSAGGLDMPLPERKNR